MSDSGKEWLGNATTIAGDLLAGAAKGAAAGSVVPGLGTVAGSLVGLASALVPHVFGTETEPLLHAAAAVVTGQGKQADQLVTLSTDPAAREQFRLEVLKIAADREMARDQAQEARDQALQVRLDAALADVADARKQTLGLAGMGSSLAWAAPMVSVIVLLAFGILSCVVLFHQVPDGSQSLANVLLGALASMAGAVVQYWVGSSAGSARKDGLLANSVSKDLLPQPAAVVPAGDVQK